MFNLINQSVPKNPTMGGVNASYRSPSVICISISNPLDNTQAITQFTKSLGLLLTLYLIDCGTWSHIEYQRRPL